MRLLQTILDGLFPPDPGRLRLAAAAKATLAGLATFLIVMGMGQVSDVPVIDRVLGFGLALFISVSVRDPTARAKAVTIALAAVGACLSTAIAALLIDQPMAGAVMLPALMFATTFFAARGPRYGSIGLVSLIAYLIALVSQQPAETLPTRFLVIVVAAAVAALVRCVLMPERPEAEVEHLRRGARDGVGKVLALVASAVAGGAWTSEGRSALKRQISRLGEIVILAQMRLAGLPKQPADGGWGWLQLLEIQLATERVARVGREDLGRPEDRAALPARIEAIRAGAQAVPRQETTGGRLGGMLEMLAHVLNEGPRSEIDHAASAAAAAPVSGWRPALQTAAATVLAMGLSELLLPDRWYWAAFAAFVMFQGTRSRGESIAKGVAFVVGTTAGLVAGVLLATLLAGQTLLSVLAIVLCVFLAFQANVIAYGVMIFWITVLLGLMFGMLGYFSFDVLMLRLEESAIGVACGVLVACLLLVRREQDVAQEAATSFLGSLRELLRSAGAALLRGEAAPDLAGRILGTEQRFRDFNAAASPGLTGFGMGHREAQRKRVVMLSACENWGREVGTIALNGTRIENAALVEIASRALPRVDARLAQLSGTSPGVAEAQTVTVDELLPDGPDGPDRQAVRLMIRLDAALARAVAEGTEPAGARPDSGALVEPGSSVRRAV